MSSIHFLINGFVIGVLASMPIGGIAVLSMQRTINNGLFSGFIVGLGAALGDFVYAAVAALGLTMISDFLMSIKTWLAVFGSIFLLIMGYKIYTSDTIKQYRGTDAKKKGHANYFVTSFFLALTNPVTIIGFTGFFASFGVITNTTLARNIVLLLSGIIIGSTSWWFGISFIINKLKNKMNIRILVTINRVAGVLLVIFGLGLMIAMFVFGKKI